jgi:hypothetical protein
LRGVDLFLEKALHREADIDCVVFVKVFCVAVAFSGVALVLVTLEMGCCVGRQFAYLPECELLQRFVRIAILRNRQRPATSDQHFILDVEQGQYRFALQSKKLVALGFVMHVYCGDQFVNSVLVDLGPIILRFK